ncbi:hypothetical protein [Mesorhizobium sp. M1403]|uniref:hypothetical protein n=1 Tax=Mesorhizobium sp. M1403 TaxID=2957097 RepID=UPI003335CF92
MAKTPLVDFDIDGGRNLVHALEKAGLPISIAAWLCLQDSADWQLFIATPDVQTYGPTTIIKFVDRIRSAINSPVRLDKVTVTNTTNHFINNIPLFSYHSEAQPLHRFRGGFLGDVDIEDGLIYKIDRTVKASKAAPRPNAEAIRKARSIAA